MASDLEKGLVLVGYRGTGKTTVGRLLARSSDRPFFDVDAEIERQLGMPISEVFERRGESAFRDAEEAVIARLTTSAAGAILATGGGAVLRPSNRKRLRGFGLVVWLTASPESLAERLARDPSGPRPSLTSAGTLGEISDVLASRLSLYREVADMELDTMRRTPDALAAEIQRRWTTLKTGRKP